jgi:uncharacterized protein involved in type VI secretion and phage assembly
MDAETLDKLSRFGLEYYGLYYGIYKGIVKDNADPQSQGRIKVQVPELGHDDALELFAYPVSPFAGNGMGIFFPPETGAFVWIMFEGGNPTLPVYVGGWWPRGHVPSDANPGGVAPMVREIKTKLGHRIIFDDGKEPGITIQTATGVIVKLKDLEQKLEIIAPLEITVMTTNATVQALQVNVQAQAVAINGMNVSINGGDKLAAAIGDSVPTPSGGVGKITGVPAQIPSTLRPLIP